MWKENHTYFAGIAKMARRAFQQGHAQQPEDPFVTMMEPTFYELVIAEDTAGLSSFLDDIVNDIPPETLNRWFRKAARLPGNWTKEQGQPGFKTDRNAWLNQFYLQYVPEDVRGDVQLTNRRLFQRSITHEQRMAEYNRLQAALGRFNQN